LVRSSTTTGEAVGEAPGGSTLGERVGEAEMATLEKETVAVDVAPGVPLAEMRLFPGQPVPVDGKLVPSDEPGFGLGASLDDLDAMRV
jgi:hypothetical protein